MTDIETGSSGRARILIVDDSSLVRLYYRGVLERAGFEVEQAINGIEGVEKLLSAPFDLVIVDVNMPRMDGFEFIARIRASANAKIRDLPAAALTAFARSEDRTKALRSGFEMHLAKPVDPGELVASIATLVRRAQRPQ